MDVGGGAPDTAQDNETGGWAPRLSAEQRRLLREVAPFLPLVVPLGMALALWSSAGG